MKIRIPYSLICCELPKILNSILFDSFDELVEDSNSKMLQLLQKNKSCITGMESTEKNLTVYLDFKDTAKEEIFAKEFNLLIEECQQ